LYETVARERKISGGANKAPYSLLTPPTQTRQDYILSCPRRRCEVVYKL